MWMLFFGFLMRRYPLEALPGGVGYVTFLAPGTCCMTVLFGASQSSISLIRDMQTGFLHRVADTPASRWLLHAGKPGADVLRLAAQALVVALLGADLVFCIGPLLVALLTLVLFAIGFASLSRPTALRARAQESMAAFVHPLLAIGVDLFVLATAEMPRFARTRDRWN